MINFNFFNTLISKSNNVVVFKYLKFSCRIPYCLFIYHIFNKVFNYIYYNNSNAITGSHFTNKYMVKIKN